MFPGQWCDVQMPKLKKLTINNIGNLAQHNLQHFLRVNNQIIDLEMTMIPIGNNMLKHIGQNLTQLENVCFDKMIDVNNSDLSLINE